VINSVRGDKNRVAASSTGGVKPTDSDRRLRVDLDDEPARSPVATLAVAAAFVAMVGAVGALAAPGLRPLVAQVIKDQFGDNRAVALLTADTTRPPGTIQVDLDALDQRIQLLAKTLAEGQANGPATGPLDEKALTAIIEATGSNQKVAVVEADLRRVEGQMLALTKMLGALETQVARVDTRVDVVDGQERQTGLRLDEMDSAMKDMGSRLGTAAAIANSALSKVDALSATVAVLEGTLTILETTVRTLDEGVKSVTSVAVAVDDKVRHVIGRTDGLDTLVGQVRDTVQAMGTAFGALSGQVAGLTGRVDDVEQRLGRGLNNPASALLAVAGRLRMAIDQGEPVTSEIAAARPLADAVGGPVKTSLDRLEALDRTIPGTYELRRSFAAAATRFLEIEGEAASPSFIGRAWESVSGLVGADAGPSPAEVAKAIVSRAARALSSGRPAEALAEVKALRGPGVSAMEAWIAMVGRRLEAEQAAYTLAEAAMRQLAGSPS
jgi:hypothetical protein